MYNPGKLQGNPGNLTGFLLVRAYESDTKFFHYTVVAPEREKIVDLLTILQPHIQDLLEARGLTLDKVIEENVGPFGLETTIESVKYTHRFYVFNFNLPRDLMSHIAMDAGLDTYEVTQGSDFDKFLAEAVEIQRAYIGNFIDQYIAKKDSKPTERETIYELTSGEGITELRNLMEMYDQALISEEGIEQIVTRYAVYEFISNYHLRPEADKLLDMLSDREEVKWSEAQIMDQITLISALVKDDYRLAHAIREKQTA